MSVTARCEVTCTTPQHGLVEIGEVKTFPFDKFDVRKHKYLKHFEELGVLAEDPGEGSEEQANIIDRIFG